MTASSLLQVMLASAFNTHEHETLYIDDSKHFYHCPSADGAPSNHSWDLFFNGTVPRPYPQDPAALAACTTFSVGDLLTLKGQLTRQALGIKADERASSGLVSKHEDESSVKELYNKLAEATRRVWVFSEPMQRVIDYETEFVRTMKGYRLVIGIQARGGDKFLEMHGYASRLTGTVLAGNGTVFQVIRRNYAQHLQGSICIIVGDDLGLSLNLTQVATEAFGCMVINRVLPMPNTSAHHYATFNESPIQHRCYSAQRVLADVEVLANADVFVGVRQSNVASLVASVRRFVYHKDKATEYDISGSVLRPF